MCKKLHITEDTTKEDLKSFRMKSPCKDCPFRTDIPHLKGWLGKARATEIANGIFKFGYSFPCHKTTIHDDYDDYDDEGYQYKGCESQCAGASIMQIKTGNTSAWMQVAERLGFTAEVQAIKDLDLNAPVFNTAQEFIDFHTTPKKVKGF